MHTLRRLNGEPTTPMLRRAAWIAILVGAAAPLAVAASLSCRREQPARPIGSAHAPQGPLTPAQFGNWNLLLITLDTVRADHLGCYGYAAAETPTIDGLAARGLLFEHAVTGVPATAPAHCTIMTGLEAPNHGVRTNGHFKLEKEVTTLAEVLKREGYATAAFVATFVLDARFGLAQGFDKYHDWINRGNAKTGGKAQPKRADTITNLATEWITAHLNQDPSTPFFVWTHYFDAHLPYDPPGEFAERFAHAPYDGEIAYTDLHLGRLLEFLDSRGQLAKTLVVVTSDHGEGLNEHGEKDHSRLIYDTTMHVPLILSAPPLHERPLRVKDITVGTVDIMPTALSLLDVRIDGRMDGVDLTRGQVGSDRAIYLETLSPRLYHGWASLHGWRRRDAKFILAPTPEFYDLTADPHELNNLLESDPNAADKFEGALRAYMTQWPSVNTTVNSLPPLRPFMLDRLAALGYVTKNVDDDPASKALPDPKDMVPLYDDLSGGDAEALEAKARRLVTTPPADSGQYRRALILAKAALAKVPDRPAFVNTLGMALYRVGNYADSMEAFVRADKLSNQPATKRNILVGTFRAMSLYRLGQRDRARTVLRRVLDMAAAAEVREDSNRGRLLERAQHLVLGE